MDDYYAIVGVDRTASREEIDRKIREQLRIWQRRTTNADLSRRQEAERRVELLGAARITLLDGQKRHDYDQRLGLPDRPVSPGPVSPGSVGPGSAGPGTATGTGNGTAAGTETGTLPTGSAGWLERARRYLANNDYQAAAHAARQARNTPNPPPEVWSVLARANAGLGNLDDALYEARQAVSMNFQNAQAHLDLAHVQEERGEWHEAFKAYEVAHRLDPQAEAPEAGMARSLASTKDPAVIVDQLERRYAKAEPGERPAAGRVLGRALVSSAEQVARGPGGGFRISTPNQVGHIERLLGRARQVTDDAAIRRAVGELETLVSRARAQSRGTSRPADSRPTAFTGTSRSRPPPPPRTNPMAVAALVCALCGLLLCLPAPVGAILGHVARSQIRERGDLGDGMAIAGIVIGWLVTGIGCCIMGYAFNEV